MNSQKLKGILGIAIMAIGLICMFFWLKYGQKIYSYESVLVASQTIEKGTVISNPSQYFKPAKIDNNAIFEGAIKPDDLESLIGLSAKQIIIKNMQVNKDFFDSSEIVLNKDQYIFKVPSSWIYTFPSSIRRKDKAHFFEVDSKLEQVLNGSAETNSSTSGPSTVNQTQERELNKIVMGSISPILESTVAYVKDSANREVVDVGENERLDGSSQVSSIEIIVTKDEKRIIENSIYKGMKLLILYRD